MQRAQCQRAPCSDRWQRSFIFSLNQTAFAVSLNTNALAAHSTVRALYAKYDGPLYNVTRSSDGTSTLIGVLSAGGFANKSAHDHFCAKLDCVISNIMDQSGKNNNLG